MKVLLIQPPTPERPIVRDMAGGFGFDGGASMLLPPLELAVIAACLREKGHEVRLIDADCEGYSAEEVLARVRGYRPDALAAQVSLPSLDDDCAFLSRARRSTTGRIFALAHIGSASLLEELLEKSRADACISGECEENIDGILSGNDTRSTARFKDGRLERGAQILTADLDAIPFAARDLLPEGYRYLLLGDGVTSMQTSRGCPYSCGYYCPYPLVQGTKWRAMSARRVIAEIEDVAARGIRRILFRDACFTFDRDRCAAICAMIAERKLDLTWWCETRVDCLDAGLLAAMRRAGCRGMNIGIETGDSRLREAGAKTGLSPEKLESVRRAAKACGMRLHFLLLIGLPGETRESVRSTYGLVRRLRPESAGVCVVTPYPGTPLHADAQANGWIESRDWRLYGGHHAVMRTASMSSGEIAQAYAFLQELFRLRDRGLAGLARQFILEQRFLTWAKGAQ